MAYDKALDAPAMSDREVSMRKWYTDARKYDAAEETDLAKAAIDKALSYMDQENEDPDVLFEAARIYRQLGHFDETTNYICRTIILSPDCAAAFLEKGIILFNQWGEDLKNGNYEPGWARHLNVLNEGL